MKGRLVLLLVRNVARLPPVHEGRDRVQPFTRVGYGVLGPLV